MCKEREPFGTVSAVQTTGGVWIAAMDGEWLGDSRGFQTAAECMAWARNFFGPNFDYQEGDAS